MCMIMYYRNPMFYIEERDKDDKIIIIKNNMSTAIAMKIEQNNQSILFYSIKRGVPNLKSEL